MSAFLHIPMGPNLRGWLGINDKLYTGDQSTDSNKLNWDEFEAFIIGNAKENPFTDEGDLIDVIDELVAMDLPKAAVSLYEACSSIWSGKNFRGELGLGIASMFLEDLDAAESHLINAQEIMPNEPAPYINIVQILFHKNDLIAARKWIEAGLDAEPNNFKLWDQMADLFHEQVGPEFGAKVEAVAKEKQSWAGACLAAEILQSGDTQLKFRMLDPYYSKGERNHEFLVELTAAMGIAGKYDRIPQVLFDAEQNSTTGVPWQLHMHVAQAHIALNDKEAAMIHLGKAKETPHIPEDAIAMIKEIESDPEQFVH
jgi:tetratricopeptide (TPR) repeat protein